MSVHKPNAKVRLAVASWNDDAPRGAVSAFCREHGVSRAWFYKVRADARVNGQWPAMELESTRPKTSPVGTRPEVVQLVLEVRAELQAAGWDYGPLSVQSKLHRRGLESPSRSTLARIFSRAGVVIPEPKKKPRSAYRRFVYPAPNCLWQIDATEWTLAQGRTVVIFQLVDDHSRLALASLVAGSETVDAAMRVVKLSIARHGIPQKFLSDNGLAFNPSRRGWAGKLVLLLQSHGVEPITGKPGKPTTQGKNERVHQTLHKYLNQQPPAETMEELQALVDAFDEYYNTQRDHQSLPRGTTPKEAWDATPIATPPTPLEAAAIWHQIERVVEPRGEINVANIRFMIGQYYAGQIIHIIHNTEVISFFDHQGTELISHPMPAPGTTYVGSKQRGPYKIHRQVSTMS